jgi:hypothetical protein
MFDLFRVPWRRVELEHVRDFLSEAQDDEGVTWEAKADDDHERKRPEGEQPGRLYPQTLHKAVSALANQLGGYLILGARWDKSERRWLLPGFVSPEDEARTWLDNVVGGLRPVPRYDARPWHLEGDRWVAVIRVDPVDEPPCMTPLGHVYERVSGKSVRVADPALLDRLIRRGREQRATAQARAEEAATLAIERDTKHPTWSVTLAVAMAPVGRETDDISSRLFVPSYGTALREALLRFVPEGEQVNGGVATGQSWLTAAGVASSARELNWSEWALTARWTGAVAASATFSVNEVPGVIAFDEVVRPGWRELAPLVERLGGYGPAHLTLMVRTAPPHGDGKIDGKFVAPEVRPQPPPQGSVFGRLRQGDDTVIARWVSVEQPSDGVLASMQREFERAAGRPSFEPEESTADQLGDDRD